MLLPFLRVSTGNANQQWVLLTAAWEAEMWESLSGVELSSEACHISGEIPTNMYLVMQLTYLSSSSHRKLWAQQQQADIWATNFFQAVVHLVRSGETKYRRWDTPTSSSSLRSPSISRKRKLKHLISSEVLGYSPSLLRCFLASHIEAHDPEPYVAFVSLPS